MFINYKGTNVLSMGAANHAAIGGTTSPQDVHWLRPGWNEFPRSIWQSNQAAPNIQQLLKKGVIQLLEVKVKVRVKDKKTGRSKVVTKVIGQDDSEIRLKHFDDARAIQIVKETLNRDILQRWLDEELRHKVKRVIIKQMEPLMAQPEDKTESDSD